MSKLKLVQSIIVLTSQLAVVFCCFAQQPFPWAQQQGNIRNPKYAPRILNPSKLEYSPIRKSNTPEAKALAEKPNSKMMSKDFMCRNTYPGGKKKIICTKYGSNKF